MSFSVIQAAAPAVAEFIAEHHKTDAGVWVLNNAVSPAELIHMLERPSVHTVAIAADGRLEGVALLIESEARLELHNVCTRAVVRGAGTALLNATRVRAIEIGKPVFLDTVSAAGFYRKFDYVQELSDRSFRLVGLTDELVQARNFMNCGNDFFSVRLNDLEGRVNFTADSFPAIRIWVESVLGDVNAIDLALRLFSKHPLVQHAIESGRRVYFPAPQFQLPSNWHLEDVTLFTIAE
jgi:hypothetical protein